MVYLCMLSCIPLWQNEQVPKFEREKKSAQAVYKTCEYTKTARGVIIVDEKISNKL